MLGRNVSNGGDKYDNRERLEHLLCIHSSSSSGRICFFHRNYIGTSKNIVRTLNEIEGKMFHLKWLMLFANVVIRAGVVTGLCSKQYVNGKKMFTLDFYHMHEIIFSRVDSERLHDCYS